MDFGPDRALPWSSQAKTAEPAQCLPFGVSFPGPSPDCFNLEMWHLALLRVFQVTLTMAVASEGVLVSVSSAPKSHGSNLHPIHSLLAVVVPASQ